MLIARTDLSLVHTSAHIPSGKRLQKILHCDACFRFYDIVMSFIENQDDAVVDLEADVQQATINVSKLASHWLPHWLSVLQ